jgi:hypothetical protein
MASMSRLVPVTKQELFQLSYAAVLKVNKSRSLPVLCFNN